MNIQARLAQLPLFLFMIFFSLSVNATEAEPVGSEQPVESEEEAPANGNYVLMETSHGDILIELYPDKAPVTVQNFKDYVNSDFYRKTMFHRVIPGFMIQGGGFDLDFQKKNNFPSIMNEADNGLKNDKWTVAMARTSDPHSATSQFFINVANNSSLNFSRKTSSGWGYAVFGKVIDGFSAVDRIEKVNTIVMMGHSNMPSLPVVILKAELLDKPPEGEA